MLMFLILGNGQQQSTKIERTVSLQEINSLSSTQKAFQQKKVF